jgi:hypothetical protein
VLGTDAASITIGDLAIHPASRNAFISDSRRSPRHGPSPGLLRRHEPDAGIHEPVLQAPGPDAFHVSTVALYAESSAVLAWLLDEPAAADMRRLLAGPSW